MFDQYFTGPSQKILELRNTVEISTIGRKIKIYGLDNFEINKDYSVAIFSLSGDKESEKFREIFYSFSCSSWKIKIIDFGILKKGYSEPDTKFAIEQIINKLSAFGILVICVGGNSALTNTVYDAINDNTDFLNIVSVDKHIGINDDKNSINNNNYLSHLIMNDNSKLNFFCNIGYLRHLNPIEKIDLVKKIKFDLFSLGDLRNDFDEVEPILRDANILNFSLESLQSNIINFKLTSTNGLSAHEACKLSRYAGLSSSMKVVMFGNVKSTLECSYILSEMVWYTIEGCNNRYLDDFSKDHDFNFYNIEVDGHNLRFYHNKISNRWWVEYVDKLITSYKKNIIPCSKNDYKLAQSSTISDRIIKRLKNKII